MATLDQSVLYAQQQFQLFALNRELEELEAVPGDVFHQKCESIRQTVNDILEPPVEECEAKSVLDDIFGEADINIYRKPWNKLQDFHRTEKLKEFITMLPIDKSKQKTLMGQMKTLLSDKVITKKGTVEYDESNCVISAIPRLVYDDDEETFIYQIKKPRISRKKVPKE